MKDKLKKNKKLRSLITLGLWGIFLLFIYFISLDRDISVNENNNVVHNEQVNSNNWDLTGDDYDFVFTYENPETKVIYTGRKYKDETVIFRETSESLNKYFIKQNIMYEVKMGSLIQIDNMPYINYQGYLNLKKIFMLIKDKNYTLENNEYFFAINDIYVKIKLTDDIIEIINLTSGNEKYELKFINVNEIDNISY